MDEFETNWRSRCSISLRLAICIVGEAFVFVIWILVAGLCQALAQWLKTHGLHEIVADVFRWCSSVGTLILALLYIMADIKDEVKRLFRS